MLDRLKYPKNLMSVLYCHSYSFLFFSLISNDLSSVHPFFFLVCSFLPFTFVLFYSFSFLKFPICLCILFNFSTRYFNRVVIIILKFLSSNSSLIFISESASIVSCLAQWVHIFLPFQISLLLPNVVCNKQTRTKTLEDSQVNIISENKHTLLSIKLLLCVAESV